METGQEIKDGDIFFQVLLSIFTIQLVVCKEEEEEKLHLKPTLIVVWTVPIAQSPSWIYYIPPL